MSLAGFIAHIGHTVVEIEHHTHHALEVAAKMVEAEAKAEVGKYQASASPFSEWPELADATKDDRSKQGFDENEPGLRTGAARDSIDHAIGHHEAVVGSNDQHLEWFELGTVKQPPRSILGIAAVHKAPDVARELGGGVVQAIIGPGVFNRRLPIP